MSDPRGRLREQYAEALKSHFSTPGEAALGHAYEIGRSALKDGLGVLDVAGMHHDALRALVNVKSLATTRAQIEKAAELFSEILSTFEMALRGYEETTVRLAAMNETLEQQVADRTAALRASERRFQDIAEVSGDWMWETDREHRFTIVFGERLDALSIRGTSLVGQTRWEGADADPATDELWTRHKADLDAHRPFRHFRYEVGSPDGARLFIAASGKPVFAEQGNFLGHRGTATDETAIVQARRRAEAAELTTRRIFETSLDLILVTDRKGTFTRVSPSAMSILDYDPEEMVGRSAVEFLYPDDLDNTRNEMRKARRAGVTRDFECRYVHKQGRIVTLWWTGVWSGSEQQYFFTGRDITERKEVERRLRDSEEQLKRAQRLAQMGSDIRNLLTDEAQWSEETYRIFGIPVGSPVPSTETFLALVHPDDRAAILVARDELTRGLNPAPFEYRILRPDGSTRYIRRESEVLRGVDGTPQYMVGTIHDVTDRRHTEDQLRQAQKMEAIGNLTGGMAHDFNNLLGVIVGNLDLARERIGGDAEMNELVAEALEAAWRGADLTRRLLAFARRQPLRPARIEVNELVSNTVRLLRRLLGEDVEVQLNLGSDIWPLTADPAQLDAALANLANNARDAMPRGGRVIITTANRPLDADYAATHSDVTPGGFVMIEVSDTGTGMSPEVMDRIFEPFFTTKEAGRGTGLGLSMVFGFLKQSGGHVNVYSELGKGTTFRLYLPRTVDEAAIRETVEAVPARRGAGETVLVVEDNPGMQRIVLRQLRELGYRVLDCERAAAALDVLQRERVDLLLTDIVMPGGFDGIELARLARERWPALRIVLTSGFPEARVDGNGDLLRGLQLLSKPYSKEELAVTMRIALDG